MNKKQSFLTEKASTTEDQHSSEEAFLNQFLKIAMDAMDMWYKSQAREEKDG